MIMAPQNCYIGPNFYAFNFVFRKFQPYHYLYIQLGF